MIGPGHHPQVHRWLAAATEFLNLCQGGEVIFIPHHNQAKAGGFMEEAQVHESDGRGDEHCARHLEDFMVPKVVEFRDALPKTGTQRIQKSILKQEGVRPETWDRVAQED